jgi:site-specific recombinase XerD
MAFRYLQNKGLGFHGHPDKNRDQRFLTDAQVKDILIAVQKSKEQFNKWWKRDECAIFLGYMLGLRIGEAVILERKHFARVGDDIVMIPTLKQRKRIRCVCPDAGCNRRLRVSPERIGQLHPCPRCGKQFLVQKPKDYHSEVFQIPTKELPFVESDVADYIGDYIKNHMRPDQRWLFESRPNYHISSSYMTRVFNTYAQMASLSSVYSWHALRHGRGVRLWNAFRDLIAVRDGLRHSGIGVASIYADLDPEARKEMKKKMEKQSFNPLDSLDSKKKRKDENDDGDKTQTGPAKSS